MLQSFLLLFLFIFPEMLGCKLLFLTPLYRMTATVLMHRVYASTAQEAAISLIANALKEAARIFSSAGATCIHVLSYHCPPPHLVPQHLTV